MWSHSRSFADIFIRIVMVVVASMVLLGGFSCEKKSTNGPKPVSQWVASNEGLENVRINTLSIHPQDPDIIFAGTFDGLYRSTDRAENWTRVDSGWTFREITALAFDSQAGEVVYAGTRGGVSTRAPTEAITGSARTPG